MINELFGLEGRSALVVGASKGLGKAMALALAGAGADVAVASRSQRLIEEVRDEIIASGTKAVAIKADINREENTIGVPGHVIDCQVIVVGVQVPSQRLREFR
jgi:NAD(P)-dependent dehydrogenase (short-subunit alcohol dehydrogenase family)